MNADEVLFLEQKYQNLLWTIFNSEEFYKDLESMEKRMQIDYEIADNYFNSNISNILFERISKYHVYKSNLLNIICPYHSPISSDIAFETEDAVIFIDQKTFDMVDNRVDKPYILFNINQITFNNINVFSGSAEYEDGTLFRDFPGVFFPNNLTAATKNGMFENKPILTYIIGLHIYPGKPDSSYYKIVNQDFEDRELYLACLPHYKTAEKDYLNNVVTKFKFYDWVDTDSEYRRYPNHLPLENPGVNFKKFRWLIDNGDGTNSPGKYYYYDDSRNSPLDESSKTVWGQVKRGNNNLFALISGSTPRIRKTLFSENEKEKWRLNTNYF